MLQTIFLEVFSIFGWSTKYPARPRDRAGATPYTGNYNPH